jgi:maleylacetoacetate isomerase
MSTILYGYWRSLATFRVRAALNLKGIEYQEVSVDLATGEQFGEEFTSLSPQHAVPLLINNGIEISQSMAILEYLEEQWPTPRLLPTDSVDRAQNRALALITIADTHPLIVPRVRRFLNTQWNLDENEQTQWAQHWFTVGNEAIERALIKAGKSKIYSFGNEVTLSDIALVSHAIGAALFKVDMSSTPVFQKIVANCMLLPAFANAHPLKQSGAPMTA